MSFSVVVAQLHIKNAGSGGGAIVYVGKYKHFLVWLELTSFYINYKHSFNVQSHREVVLVCSLWELMVLIQSGMPHFSSSQLQ